MTRASRIAVLVLPEKAVLLIRLRPITPGLREVCLIWRQNICGHTFPGLRMKFHAQYNYRSKFGLVGMVITKMVMRTMDFKLLSCMSCISSTKKSVKEIVAPTGQDDNVIAEQELVLSGEQVATSSF